jgi:hypothetical protein
MCEVIKSMEMTGNSVKDKSSANVENELCNEPCMNNEESDNDKIMNTKICFYGFKKMINYLFF